MKKILAPIDFSDNSKNALDYAIELAKKLKARLILMHSFHPSMAESMSDAYKLIRDKDMKEKEDTLKMWKAAVKKSNKSLNCQTIFTGGNPAEEIIQAARKNKIDLVVMGTKGASGLREVFIGSNTAKVIGEVACPVFSIPQDYQYRAFKRIIFATNYNDSDVASIRFLVQLAKLYRAELKIVHVVDGERMDGYEDDMLDYFIGQVKKSIEYKNMNFHLLKDSNIKKSLSDFIRQNNIDLFSLSTEKKTLFEKLFNSSLTKQFAYHTQMPLLAFHVFDINDNDLF